MAPWNTFSELPFSTDGTQGAYREPTDLVAGFEGDFYFSVTEQHAVFRLSSDGQVERVAGTGSPGHAGNNVPGINAELTYPRGLTKRPNELWIASGTVIRVLDLSTRLLRTAGGSALARDGRPAVLWRDLIEATKNYQSKAEENPDFEKDLMDAIFSGLMANGTTLQQSTLPTLNRLLYLDDGLYFSDAVRMAVFRGPELRYLTIMTHENGAHPCLSHNAPAEIQAMPAVNGLGFDLNGDLLMAVGLPIAYYPFRVSLQTGRLLSVLNPAGPDNCASIDQLMFSQYSAFIPFGDQGYLMLRAQSHAEIKTHFENNPGDLYGSMTLQPILLGHDGTFRALAEPLVEPDLAARAAGSLLLQPHSFAVSPDRTRVYYIRSMVSAADIPGRRLPSRGFGFMLSEMDLTSRTTRVLLIQPPSDDTAVPRDLFLYKTNQNSVVSGDHQSNFLGRNYIDPRAHVRQSPDGRSLLFSLQPFSSIFRYNLETNSLSTWLKRPSGKEPASFSISSNGELFLIDASESVVRLTPPPAGRLSPLAEQDPASWTEQTVIDGKLRNLCAARFENAPSMAFLCRGIVKDLAVKDACAPENPDGRITLAVQQKFSLQAASSLSQVSIIETGCN